MRKRIFGRRLKRDINQRKLLFKSLMRELVVHGRIKTTEAKAKAVRGEVEKLVTKAKIQGDASRVHLQKYFTHDVMNKMIHDIAPLFKDRPGGYTRIMKMGNRIKDDAPMVMMEWVEVVVPTEVVDDKKKKSTKSGGKKSYRTNQSAVKASADKKESIVKKEPKKTTAPSKNVKTTKVRKPSV